VSRVNVERSVCIGAGQCVAIAPEAFELDEEYLSRPLPAAEAVDEALLRGAAEACPSGAITLSSKPRTEEDR
jgi:ferredoxin